MKQIFLISFFISFAINFGQTQFLVDRFAIQAQAHLPLSKNDNVIPSVGASLGTTFRLFGSGNLMSYAGLDLGLLRARVQNSPISDEQRLTDYDLKVSTVGGDFLVAFFIDPSERFSMGVSAGIEYAINKHSKGTLETTIFDVKGEEILTYSEYSKWEMPENQVRGILSIYLNHHFLFGERKMTLGPFYDYGSVVLGDYENEVASSKFGIQMGVEL